MSIYIYRSTDTSAPVLNSVAGTLINIFDACLVNGYDDKTSMGQTKVFSGTNIAVYRMPVGTSQMYLAVDDTAGQVARFRGFSSITSAWSSAMNLNTMTNPVGKNPFPSDWQLSGGEYMWKTNNTNGNATARPQSLYSDGTIFYFYSDYNGDGGTAGRQFSFGDIEPYNPNETNSCIIIGGYSDGQNRIMQFCNVGSTLAGHYLALRYDGISVSNACGKIPMYSYHTGYRIGSPNDSFPAYPDPVVGGLIISPIQIIEPTAGSCSYLRGRLPGLWAPCTGVGFNNGDVITGTMGDLAGRTFEALRSITCYSTAQCACNALMETSDTQRTVNFR